MRVMVISDTHGLVKEVQQAVHTMKPERILHCGDFCTEKDTYPFSEMIKVRGNCDFAMDVPLIRELKWNGLKVLMTHGHRYGVKEGLLQISYLAEERGAHLVLFGHSHFPVCEEDRGRIFLNPGSFYKPRGYAVPTFVMMDLIPNDSYIEIDIVFYNRSYQKVADRGGNFKIEL